MSRAGVIYDRIGDDYSSRRRPDPRWMARVERALEGDRTLLNVGAGAGSYEPAGLRVVALEPSWRMIRQRAASAAPVVRGVAEKLPLADRSVDASLAVLTVHHWSEARAGLAEMCRVARKQIVLTWDPRVFARELWLVRDYLPEIVGREEDLATLETVSEALAPSEVEVLPVPHDCTDGFLGAYWRRPSAYLDATVRAATSGLALLDRGVVAAAMKRLESDLAAGRWRARHADLLDRDAIDLGYRLVVAECGR